jgi:F5/8 type C domain
MPLSPPAETAKKLVDAFLLREREKDVALRTPLQQENIARYYGAARARIRGARQIVDAEGVAALALYKEAAALLIAALAQAGETEKVEVRSTSSEAWRDFEQLSKAPKELRLPAEAERARTVLSSDDPLAPDALSPDELRGATGAAAATVARLASAVDPRSPRDIQSARAFRLLCAGLVAIFLLFELGVAIFTKKNIALNKPATASSQRMGAPPPAGINNGEIEPGFGFHTGVETNPWVRIDLEGSHPIHEVRVYNRGDFDPSTALPLVLQFSGDGSEYTDVEERTEPFTRTSPWVVKVDGRSARFVRVLQPKVGGFIALTEIEVY